MAMSVDHSRNNNRIDTQRIASGITTLQHTAGGDPEHLLCALDTLSLKAWWDNRASRLLTQA